MTTQLYENLTNFFGNATARARQTFVVEDVCASEFLREQMHLAGGPLFASEDECLDFFHPDQNATSRFIRFYFLAIIIPVGLLLNILAGVVFLRSKLRQSATALYFSALACADNTVLFAELLNWLNTEANRSEYITGLNFVHAASGACKFVQFLRYFGWLLSAWLVVIICIERFIAVVFAFRADSTLSRRNSKFIIPALVVICMGLSSPALFFLGSNPTQGKLLCSVHYEHSDGHFGWLIAVTVVGELAIPSVIVTVFTALIICQLVKASRQRAALTSGQQNRAGMNETVALVSVAIAFVTLRAPYFVSYTYYLITKDNSPSSLQARDLTYIFAILNYAINFFLYMITTRTFRTELKNVFSWKAMNKRNKRLEPTSQIHKKSSVGKDSSQSTALTSTSGAETAV